jgi:hypothetical protein
MMRNTTIHLFALGAALGLMWPAVGWAQEDSTARAARLLRGADSERVPGQMADRGGPGAEGRGPKPPGGDFGGPPPKPPHEGDFGDRPAPPPHEGGYGPPRLGGEGRAQEPRLPHEDWSDLEKNDPEMYKLLREDMALERQTRELAAQYRRAPKESREQIRQQIQQLTEKHFDVRQQRRLLELKRVEEELQRLREAVARREKARQDLVQKRVSELLGADDEVRF